MPGGEGQEAARAGVERSPGPVERVRKASFPVSRRGYDKGEVDRFLARMADWLESRLREEARSTAIREELERVGERTKRLLTEAHEIASSMRAEAEEKAGQTLKQARQEAEEATKAAKSDATKRRSEADTYAERTRIEADEYAKETRAEVETVAKRLRTEAEQALDRAREEAEEKARAIAVQAARRHEELQATISKLESRRDSVIAELRRLSSELAGTATRPLGADQREAQDGDTAEREPPDEEAGIELEGDVGTDEEDVGTDEEDAVGLYEELDERPPRSPRFVEDEEEEAARRRDELRNW